MFDFLLFALCECLIPVVVALTLLVTCQVGCLPSGRTTVSSSAQAEFFDASNDPVG